MNMRAKYVIAGIVAVVCLIGVLSFFGVFNREKTPEQIISDAFENVDRDHVDSIEIFTDGMPPDMQADINGDTYCSNCDKFIEGKVRICPYCGQYVD